MSKVTLDKETFKALASETRLDVLHALDERRKTTTEIAAELELNKATVHEHLKLLTAVGLVKKNDEGRKWIYHELTWDGRKLLHPDQGTIFNVLLGLSIAASGGAVGILGQAAGWWFREAQPSESELAGSPDDGKEFSSAADSTDTGAPEDGGSSSSSSSSATSSSSSGSSSGTQSSSPETVFDSESGSALEAEGTDDTEGSPFPWIGIALALTAVLLINLAIFLRKRK